MTTIEDRKVRPIKRPMILRAVITPEEYEDLVRVYWRYEGGDGRSQPTRRDLESWMINSWNAAMEDFYATEGESSWQR